MSVTAAPFSYPSHREWIFCLTPYHCTLHRKSGNRLQNYKHQNRYQISSLRILAAAVAPPATPPIITTFIYLMPFLGSCLCHPYFFICIAHFLQIKYIFSILLYHNDIIHYTHFTASIQSFLFYDK